MCSCWHITWVFLIRSSMRSGNSFSGNAVVFLLISLVCYFLVIYAINFPVPLGSKVGRLHCGRFGNAVVFLLITLVC
jgi:hypothetical protein